MTRIRMDASFRTVRAAVRQCAYRGALLRRRVDAGEVTAVGIAEVQVVSQSMTRGDHRPLLARIGRTGAGYREARGWLTQRLVDLLAGLPVPTVSRRQGPWDRRDSHRPRTPTEGRRAG